MSVLAHFLLASLLLQPQVCLPQFQLSKCCQGCSPVSTPDPVGTFTCSAVMRSQAQSGKLAACLPGFCLLWMLAVMAVISTDPNSGPLASFSFNKVSLKPPKPPSASNNSWVGKFLASFLPLVCSDLFSQSFFHAVLSPWSSTDGTMVYINIV